MLKKINKVLNYALIAILVIAVGVIILVTFNPTNKFQLLRVMSGSMEPAIKVGSLVFVKKVDPVSLKENDVLNYVNPKEDKITVTHRIVKIEEKDGQKVFTTKGDANNSADPDPVFQNQVRGRISFSIPFLGFLSDWLKKPKGLILLVIIPAILVIIGEMANIKKTIEENARKKFERDLLIRQSEFRESVSTGFQTQTIKRKKII